MILYFGIENSLLNWEYKTEIITDQITFSSKKNISTSIFSGQDSLVFVFSEVLKNKNFSDAVIDFHTGSHMSLISLNYH